MSEKVKTVVIEWNKENETRKEIIELQETCARVNKWWSDWKKYKKAELTEEEKRAFEQESLAKGINVDGGWGMNL